MRIGILGSGLIGGKLGTVFARAGHEVVFSYSRSERKLKRLARQAGGKARAGTPGEAARACEVLFDVFAARRRRHRPSLIYYGDDARAKTVARRLIRDIGFEPLDAGPLRVARVAEPFTLLIAQLAYEGRRGPQLAYRFEWYGT